MSNIKLFDSKQIRTVWNDSDQKWYFVVAEVVQVLTDTPNPTDYIKKRESAMNCFLKGGDKLSPPF